MTQAAEEIDTVPEAVGVFDDADSLQATIDELQEHGFARHSLSVLADAKAVEEKLGHIYKRVEEEEDDPKAPRTIFVPLESIGDAEGALIGFPLYVAATAATVIVAASGGTLLTAIMAATGAGAGGALIGGIFAKMVAKHHADYIQDQIDHGGLLLWVNLPDAEHEKKAVEILKKHSAHDVHVHNIPITSL
ncbi:MAG: hypothetical protein O3A58_02670 [Proteobacteria bacterium]|nr:hypothetical protein [Pseudomonadota bacterium]MDA1056718.1 hypothetical protein [Pseudomonadota bacterium]